MNYPILPLTLDSPLSVWYEKLCNRIQASDVPVRLSMDTCREIAFLSDPARWFEAFAWCEYAVDTAFDTEATKDFFEWIFKGFDCNALVDLSAADYDWFWRKMQALFDRFSPKAPDVLVEKALQYFSARREYADKEKTLFYLHQAIERGSEAAETILGYYYYVGMLGTTDKARGMEMMNRAVTERGKARVAIYKGYIALAEKRPEEAETLLATLDPLTSDPFINRLVGEQRAFLQEMKGRFEEAAEGYLQVLEWIPSAFAMLRLGCLYYGNRLAVSDPPTGLEWMEKAFRYGRPDAAEALFYCYFESGEAWQDEISALAWLEKGFAYNNGFCAYQLAYLYLYDDTYKNTEKGLHYLEGAMRMNCAEAYLMQADRYHEGDDGEKNLSACRRMLEQAAALGSGEAAYRLGGLHDSGELSADGAPDFARALAWYEKAGEMGCLSGCEYAGRYHLTGIGSDPDPLAAKQWYEKGAEGGSPYCMVELAFLYHDGTGVEKDFSKSLQYIRQAAERNYPHGEYLLARCYKYGRGVEENPDEAVSYFRKAAEQGHAEAQVELGVCYETGYGVQVNEGEAFAYYLKGAGAGSLLARFRAGLCYYYGTGVKENKREAFRWFNEAASAGEIGSIYYKGKMRMDGEGCDANWEEGIALLREAAENENRYAQFDLGNCYLAGKGVEENSDKAMEWFQRAADNGHEQALKVTGRRRRR